MSEQNEAVAVAFDTNAQDVLLAAALFDQKNKRNISRSLQLMGVMVLILMFSNYAFKEPGNLVNWFMLVLVGAFGVYVWRFPEWSNRRYAQRKAENSPHYELAVTTDGIDVSEPPARYSIPFAGGDPVAAWEYGGIIALSFDKNRLIAVPLEQLSSETADLLRLTLRQGLGDRYEIVSELKKQI